MFSVNLGAMYNPGELYVGKPECGDHSWELFNSVLEKYNLGDMLIINGGFISLYLINYNFEKFQKDEMNGDRETFKYGVYPGELREDIYSDPCIEKLSCPIIGCSNFKINDVVARINDDGELWHLDCLFNILKQNLSYENVKFLVIYFLFK